MNHDKKEKFGKILVKKLNERIMKKLLKIKKN